MLAMTPVYPAHLLGSTEYFKFHLTEELLDAGGFPRAHSWSVAPLGQNP